MFEPFEGRAVSRDWDTAVEKLFSRPFSDRTSAIQPIGVVVERKKREGERERENPCYARSKDIATEISLRWKERWNRTALLETRLKINLVLRKQGSSIERFKKGKGKQTERCVKSRCNDDFFEKPFLATHVHSPLTHSRVAKNNVEWIFPRAVALSSLGRRTMRVKIMAEREKSFVIEGRSGVFHNRARISQPEPCDWQTVRRAGW